MKKDTKTSDAPPVVPEQQLNTAPGAPIAQAPAPDAVAKRAAALRIFGTSCGLACMWGGIWLADKQILDASGLPQSMLLMRICSFLVYVLMMFAVRYYLTHGGTHPWRFIGVQAVVSFVLFGMGAAFEVGVVHGTTDDPSLWGASFIALFMTKVIGGAVTLGLACSFAFLDASVVMRANSLGMLGAFALYSLFTQLSHTILLSRVEIVLVATVLLVCSLLLGRLSARGVPDDQLIARTAASSSPVDSTGVIPRPLRKVMRPGYMVIILFAALMLGFLRNGLGGGVGFITGDPHANPVSLVALVALIAIAFLWKGLRIEHVFYGALLCTTVGVLLEPLLDSMVPGMALVLCGIGTSLFEVVMWSLVVWVARNCTNVMYAAMAARTVAVLGHLLGTVVVVIVGLVVAEPAVNVQQASGLVMAFLCVLLLVVFARFPQLQVPFFTPTLPDDDSALANPRTQFIPPKQNPAAPSDGAEEGSAEAEEQELPAEVSEQAFWQQPCDAVAQRYHLTAREREVLELMVRGRNMPFIQEELCISRNTLKMHVRNMYQKMDAHSRQDVIDIVEAARQ